ncbi:MAG: glutaminyl-peptide cyclotransferase [Oligoflexia bacterium]|nr:glutaminyl-peptide cyclotransferase [Oligoflexia bacterium]
MKKVKIIIIFLFVFLLIFSMICLAQTEISTNLSNEVSMNDNPCLVGSNFSGLKESDTFKNYQIVQLEKLHHPGKYRFTEGLEYHDGYLYEGTGKIYSSFIKKIDITKSYIVMEKKTSTVLHRSFGEGITIHNDKLIQLTYKNGQAYVYNLNNFKKIKTFSYKGEGWGLTHNENCFIMSNGTSNINFRNFDNFSIEYTLKVTQDGKAVAGMNELEYVNGVIFANIFPLDYIIMIDATNGKVIGKINGKELGCTTGKDNVLNGIAYDEIEDVFYLTGKNCKYIYKVRFYPQ